MNQGIINVTLNRDGPPTPWGFRLHGGKDIGYPLTIQRVFLGSPSQNELQRGDIILGINDQDATGLSHMEAHDVIKTAGNQLRVHVHRLPGAPQSQFTPMSPAAKSNVHPLANAVSTAAKQTSFTQPTPKVNQPYRVTTPHSWTPTQQPTCSSPCGFQPANPHKIQNTPKSKPRPPAQPYFMQKLPSKTYSPVPAAPSPSLSSSLGEDGPQLVNLQYNSPLGLYSKEALAETIKAQSTMQPKNKPKSPLPAVVTKSSPVANQDNPTTPGALSPARPGTKLTNIMDITLSPTFQMIQEAENRSVSPRPESKTPPPPPPPMMRASAAGPLRYSPGGYQDPTVNAFGAPKETIHQSGSFKTLMAALAFSGNKDL